LGKQKVGVLTRREQGVVKALAGETAASCVMLQEGELLLLLLLLPLLLLLAEEDDKRPPPKKAEIVAAPAITVVAMMMMMMMMMISLLKNSSTHFLFHSLLQYTQLQIDKHDKYQPQFPLSQVQNSGETEEHRHRDREEWVGWRS